MTFLFISVHGFRNRFFLAYTAKEKRLIPTKLGTDLCYCILVVGSERPGSHGRNFLTFEPPWQHVQWVFLIVFKNSDEIISGHDFMHYSKRFVLKNKYI